MGSTSTRRRGASLVESLILIIVVVMSLGAVFTTVNWSIRSYSAGRQDLESRKVLFTWYQTFEAMWQPQRPNQGFASLTAMAQDRIETVGNTLGTWHNGVAIIRGYTVEAVPTVQENTGALNVTVTISSGGRVLVDSAVRTFNIFFGESVADTTGRR